MVDKKNLSVMIQKVIEELKDYSPDILVVPVIFRYEVEEKDEKGEEF